MTYRNNPNQESLEKSISSDKANEAGDLAEPRAGAKTDRFRTPCRSMSRVFAYCQASTPERSTDNQVQEIAAAGFTIDERRIITKVVSGSQEAMKRPGFSELKDKLEEGGVLVVTKLIGSDATQ